MATDNLMKRLLEAGVHFGHHSRRWNPKMKKYLFGERNKIYIIDLQRTVEGLTPACEFLKGVAAKGGKILFVGTKRQAKEIVLTEAEKVEMPYVNERWLGGALTNFQTIRKSVSRLKEISKLQEEGTFELLSKKEQSILSKEMGKLKKNLSGLVKMDSLPQALFIIDARSEGIAVKEANKLGIPIAALVDTNSSPEGIDYVIPGNDDAIKSIRIITSLIAEAVLEGNEQFKGVKESEVQDVG